MQFNYEMFVELQNKVQQIVCLNGSGVYASIDGLSFDEGGVSVNTSENFRGDTSYESDYYTWSDLEQDLDYFRNMFVERAKDKERLKQESEVAMEQYQLKADEREFERLKEKLGK